MKKVKLLFEKVSLKKNKWTDVFKQKIDQETKLDLWDLYVNSYKKIGMQFVNKDEFLNEFDFYLLIDVDADEKPDAFIAYKKTKVGNKLATIGTDGSREAKNEVFKFMVKLLKQKGWFIGCSGKVKEGLEKAGLKKVTDPEVIKKTWYKYDIEYIGNGEYWRNITGIGKVKKSLYGRPLV